VTRVGSSLMQHLDELVPESHASLKRVIVHEDWYQAWVRKRNAGGYAGLVVAGVVVL
jgi:hypothetical protein